MTTLFTFIISHALDWVDITKALEADPKATVAEAQKWAGLSGQRAWNASEDVYIQVKREFKNI